MDTYDWKLVLYSSSFTVQYYQLSLSLRRLFFTKWIMREQCSHFCERHEGVHPVNEVAEIMPSLVESRTPGLVIRSPMNDASCRIQPAQHSFAKALDTSKLSIREVGSSVDSQTLIPSTPPGRQRVGRRPRHLSALTYTTLWLFPMSGPPSSRVPIELWRHILHFAFFLEFDEADIQLWGTWKRRRLQHDIKGGYHALWDVRARLRMVNRCWNELVDKLPSTWVRIRASETPDLTLKTISSFLGNIPLPASVMPRLRRHTLQTLSLMCPAGSATYIFPEITRNAHTLTHLQALHVGLRGYCTEDASRCVISLIAAFAQDLLTLRVTVPMINVETPPNLRFPKLRRLRVDCNTESPYTNLGVPFWGLPSIQWLELPSFSHHSFPGAKPQWAPQLQTLVLRYIPPPHTEDLWSCFSTLKTIKVLGPVLYDSVLLGPDSSIRELVVRGPLKSLNDSLTVLETFIGVAGPSKRHH